MSPELIRALSLALLALQDIGKDVKTIDDQEPDQKEDDQIFYESEEESYAGAYSEILALFIFEYCGRISDEF